MNLDSLRSEAVAVVSDADSLELLEELRIKYLGRKSALVSVLRDLKNLSDEDKRIIGPKANALRSDLDELIAGRHTELKAAQQSRLLATDSLDLTLPGRIPRRGVAHPLVEVIQRIEDVFVGLGYQVATGPEVETDWHNFEALNIPPEHPARGLMDTFYVDGPKGPQSALLRTHTSPVQIRTMETTAPPIYVICPGRVYRLDQPDASHSPFFHQVEGLAVDKGLTYADLNGTVTAFAQAAFGSDTKSRLVPSYYQFTEPSCELQVTCFLCGGKGCSHCAYGWIGIGGAGMVDPNVFEAVRIDPEVYTGFAFGMSMEKPAMWQYGITDMRLLSGGDQRFLAQFRGRNLGD